MRDAQLCEAGAVEAGYQLLRNWLPVGALEPLRARVRELPLTPVRAKAGMNVPYGVLDGHRVRALAPDIAELAAGPMRAALEAALGLRLQFMADGKRDLRVQRYAKNEGLFWHIDGGTFGAVLTLDNDCGGRVEILNPRVSRILGPATYVLFPFQRLFSLAGPEVLEPAPGDLMLIAGKRVVHRVYSPRDGARIVIAASYDPVGMRRPVVRDAIARWLNY